MPRSKNKQKRVRHKRAVARKRRITRKKTAKKAER
jgi:hypothetical protein